MSRLKCPRGCGGTRSSKTSRSRQCPSCGAKRTPVVKKSLPIATDSWTWAAVPARAERPVAVTWSVSR